MNTEIAVETIGGKKYSCQVVNGIRYIDGKTVDEFIKTLPFDVMIQAAIIGKEITDDSSKSPQKMFNELHQAKNN